MIHNIFYLLKLHIINYLDNFLYNIYILLNYQWWYNIYIHYHIYILKLDKHNHLYNVLHINMDAIFFTQNPQKSQNLLDAKFASHCDSYNSAHSACNNNITSP